MVTNNYFNTNIKKNIHLNVFLENLSIYIDEPIYIYGSILRSDYNPKSDVDVCIFSDNIDGLKTKLQSFLKVHDKKQFKTIYWRLPNTKRLAVGYKIFYKNIKNNLLVEISVYEKKYKEEILTEHYSKTIIPFYATMMLYLIKFLFYDLGIMPKKWYMYYKKIILSVCIGKKKDEFIVV